MTDLASVHSSAHFLQLQHISVYYNPEVNYSPNRISGGGGGSVSSGNEEMSCWLYDKKKCEEQKEEALDRIKWRNRFGRGCGPVV
jgi:hypothetical protein